MTKRLGWLPDLPDVRDFTFKAPLPAVALPDTVDLRPECPPVYDQGNLGSCTANAVVAAIEVARKGEGKPLYRFSRLFVYRKARWLEGSVEWDDGAYIRDAIKAVAVNGAPRESLWPYDIDKFAERPPTPVWLNAAEHKVLRYERIAQHHNLMRSRLASGLPFVAGFSVYSSFMSDEVARTGIAHMPQGFERLEGGHAILVVGYDEGEARWLCRNSWGEGWGMAGYFTLPYAYLLNPNLSDDFWAVNLV